MMCQSHNWPPALATALPIPYIGHIERDTPPPLLQTMRKIEQQMNNAIATQTDWKSANTEVINFYNDAKEWVVASVFLHGNLIAEVGDTFLRLFDGGWQSNTTKSRLNAILREHGRGGECVFQKQFEWFITMNTDRGMETVPFRSSMKLA